MCEKEKELEEEDELPPPFYNNEAAYPKKDGKDSDLNSKGRTGKDKCDSVHKDMGE